MGNSYTYGNNLGSIVSTMFEKDLDRSSCRSLAQGGVTLADHANFAGSSGHQWNITLNGGTEWKYVVLQDQSQIPGFYTNTSYWQNSLAGAKKLNSMIDEAGGETVFLMTWGRRSGDPMNPGLYSNFTVMQERLESGYRMYAENCSTSERPAYVAPVGLAWKYVHDNVTERGLDPTLPGNLFYDLYVSDESHPSLLGSYLTGCVLYSTMTGNPPFGMVQHSSINGSYSSLIERAAYEAVFDLTPDYPYPWENGKGISYATENHLEGNLLLGNNENGILIVDDNDRDNSIFGNDLIKISGSSILGYDGGEMNSWDDGTMGNFWSDMSTRYPSSTHNGSVWNQTYVIPNGAADNYPLAFPVHEIDLSEPEADAGDDIVVDQNTMVELNGSGSFDDVGVINYTWSFTYDDRSLDLYGEVVSFLFEIPGEYSISLKVSDRTGKWGEDMKSVRVVQTVFPDITPPIAPRDIERWFRIKNDTSLKISSGNWTDDKSSITNYTWVLDIDGDRIEINGSEFEHHFRVPGDHTIFLNVTNGFGLWSVLEFYVDVFLDISPPTVFVPALVIIEQNETVILNGSQCFDDIDEDLNFSWCIPQYSICLFGQHNRFTFPDAGFFDILLNVTDKSGNTGFDSFSVWVLDITPPEILSMDILSIEQHGQYLFNGSRVTDNVGVIEYSWMVVGPERFNSTEKSFIHVFDIAGDYRITLHVTDSAGNNASLTYSLQVTDTTDPVPNIKILTSNLTVGTNVSFDGSASCDNVGIVEMVWIIDGKYYFGLNASHIFVEPGIYVVILSILDEAGNIGQDTIEINITTAKIIDTVEEPEIVENDRDLMFIFFIIFILVLFFAMSGIIVWTRFKMDIFEE